MGGKGGGIIKLEGKDVKKLYVIMCTWLRRGSGHPCIACRTWNDVEGLFHPSLREK